MPQPNTKIAQTNIRRKTSSLKKKANGTKHQAPKPTHPSCRSSAPATKKKKIVARTFPTTIRIKLHLPKPTVLPWRETLPNELWIGTVEDYLGHQQVLITTLQAPLALGAQLHVRGRTTNLFHLIDSIEWNHQALVQAEAGQTVGIKTPNKVRKHDFIYLVSQANA